MGILSISTETLEKARDTLFFALKDDPLLLWIFGGPNNYDKKAAWAMEKWIKWCMVYGLAHTLPGYTAVSLWMKPTKHNLTLKNIFQSGFFNAPFVLGLSIFNRMILLDKAIHQEQQKYLRTNNFWYCWLFGTQAGCQEEDETLINVMTAKAAIQVLNTARKENIPLLENLGYNLFSTIQLADSSLNVYCMIKNHK